MSDLTERLRAVWPNPDSLGHEAAARIEELEGALRLLRAVAFQAHHFRGYPDGPCSTTAFAMALREADAALASGEGKKIAENAKCSAPKPADEPVSERAVPVTGGGNAEG